MSHVNSFYTATGNRHVPCAFQTNLYIYICVYVYIYNLSHIFPRRHSYEDGHFLRLGLSSHDGRPQPPPTAARLQSPRGATKKADTVMAIYQL